MKPAAATRRPELLPFIAVLLLLGGLIGVGAFVVIRIRGEKRAARLAAEEQVAAVAARLKELNPGFDGRVTHRIEYGAVWELGFSTANVTDISPVRALTELNELTLEAGPPTGRMFSDLSPLKGMKLTKLKCVGTRVSDLSPLNGMELKTLWIDATKVTDLSPLKDMELTSLSCFFTGVADLSPLKNVNLCVLGCGATRVSDLSPLKDMNLSELNCSITRVSDLSPLKDMNLTKLWCSSTKVSDLSPLKGMKLTLLHCNNTKVADLSPLKGMPLEELQCDFVPERDAEIIRSIMTLEKINRRTAKEFWKEVDAKKP